MSFQNWLIRLAKTNVLFPHKYIKKETYKSTDLQRAEIKAYRDNNYDLLRITKRKSSFRPTSSTLRS